MEVAEAVSVTEQPTVHQRQCSQGEEFREGFPGLAEAFCRSQLYHN